MNNNFIEILKPLKIVIPLPTIWEGRHYIFELFVYVHACARLRQACVDLLEFGSQLGHPSLQSNIYFRFVPLRCSLWPVTAFNGS